MYNAVCEQCKKEYIVSKRMEKCPYCHTKGLLMNVGFFRKLDSTYTYKVFVIGYRDEVGCICELEDMQIARSFCENSERLYIQINKK